MRASINGPGIDKAELGNAVLFIWNTKGLFFSFFFDTEKIDVLEISNAEENNNPVNCRLYSAKKKVQFGLLCNVTKINISFTKSILKRPTMTVRYSSKSQALFPPMGRLYKQESFISGLMLCMASRYLLCISTALWQQHFLYKVSASLTRWNRSYLVLASQMPHVNRNLAVKGKAVRSKVIRSTLGMSRMHN